MSDNKSTKKLKDLMNIDKMMIENLEDELTKKLNDLDVAMDIVKTKSTEYIFDSIHDFPIEKKGDMDQLLNALLALKNADKDVEKALRILKEKKTCVAEYYSNEIELLELHQQQLQVDYNVASL